MNLERPLSPSDCFSPALSFSIPALFFYDPIFKNADYIRGGGFDPIISVGAIFEIFLAICNTATAIVIFPVTKRTSESGALAYVAVRIIESLITVYTLALGFKIIPSGQVA